MNTRSAVFALALGLAYAGSAHAQVVGYNFRTGDLWVDNQLGYMNDYGQRNRDYFVDDVVGSFGAPRYLVNDLLTTRKFSPGDVYYACALAYETHRPCGDVAKMYEQNRGKGWGVVAMSMGIKPGSAEFHALKGQVGKSNGKFKARSSTGMSSPGNSGKGKSEHSDDGPGNFGNRGHSDEGGPGNSGKGNNGKGNEGKGNGKGKDKDKSKGGGH
jgi:hypothetical protein